jgi:hypothetical protein
MIGDGASKKSRSGSSNMESTARMATDAPPKPPCELLEEEEDLHDTSWLMANRQGYEALRT